MMLHWVPRHHWIRIYTGQVGPPCWHREMYLGLVLHYTVSVLGWGITLIRMPETPMTRRAVEYYR